MRAKKALEKFPTIEIAFVIDSHFSFPKESPEP